MGNRKSKPIQNCRADVERNATATNVADVTSNPYTTATSQASNIHNCGINQGAGGQIRAEILTIINNPSPAATSTIAIKSTFRFNIPTPNRHFKGRRNTMEDIRDYFTSLPPQTADCWERIVAIVGLGGMGKTETAYKFAAEYKELFPSVAWINAETEQSALTSFLELAKHLGVVPKDKKIADVDLNIVREVYREIGLRDIGSVLLVFDNAIQLNSNGTEFGILKYLPTEDLPNGRFPYIIITTQTHYWERGINKFQVDGLTEEESLDFFRSCFQVKAPDCDEGFKQLHKLMEGYPLVLNLAAAQIDYNPKNDTVHHLEQQISNYIDKLQKEQNKLLTEKMSRAWPSSYNKTLSNVWQVTFERIHEENKGREALELMQLMSFLHVPIDSDDVLRMLVRSSDCPHASDKELQSGVTDLFRVLERFYAVRILLVPRCGLDMDANCRD